MIPYTATIAKRFTFDAAHSLPRMPDGHKCRCLHGHTYEVEVVLAGPVDAFSGLLIDYEQLAVAWAPLHHELDHKHLNLVEGLENPTTEVLVGWIAKRLALEFSLPATRTYPACTLLYAVRVKESSTTWCEVLVEDLWVVGLVPQPFVRRAPGFPTLLG